MSRGFIAVSRGIFDHPIFANEPYTEREAWLWLVEQAVWKDCRAHVGRSVVDLKRGECAFSIRFMAMKWQWPEIRVRRFLDRLTTDAMVSIRASKQATHITICNYEKYQGLRRADEQTNEQTSERTSGAKKEPLTTNHTPLRGVTRLRAHRIPDDWVPSEVDTEFARKLGLSNTQIARQAERFRDYWRAKSGQGATKLDWSATWRNWVRTEAEKIGCDPPTDNVIPIGSSKFYAAFGSRELDAWDDYNRKTKGVTMPRDKRGGWLCDSRWPPGHETQAARG